MSKTHLPVTGFAFDMITSEDRQTTVAVLTLESGELRFDFAINEDGARAMVGNLQQFLHLMETRSKRPN
jgi:hypothetical protein